MLAAPVDPVGCVSGWSWCGGGLGDEVFDFRDGERDQARIGGWGLVGVLPLFSYSNDHTEYVTAPGERGTSIVGRSQQGTSTRYHLSECVFPPRPETPVEDGGDEAMVRLLTTSFRHRPRAGSC